LGPILVDRKGTAALLGISVRTLFDLVRNGELTPVRIGARQLFRRTDLAKFARRSHHKTGANARRHGRKA